MYIYLYYFPSINPLFIILHNTSISLILFGVFNLRSFLIEHNVILWTIQHVYYFTEMFQASFRLSNNSAETLDGVVSPTFISSLLISCCIFLSPSLFCFGNSGNMFFHSRCVEGNVLNTPVSVIKSVGFIYSNLWLVIISEK